MFKKRKIFLLYVVSAWAIIATLILGFILFTSDNSKPQNNIENSPPIVGFGVSCPVNLPDTLGSSWRGITINESTLIDIQNLYGVIAHRIEPRQSIRSTYSDVYAISLTREFAENVRIAQGARLCLSPNNEISALYLSVGFDAELPDGNYESWLTRYGIPDAVSWSSSEDWYQRTAIWSSQGIAVGLDIINPSASQLTASVNSALFFSPADNAQLDEYPFDWLLQFDAPDTVPPTEKLNLENPFNS